MLLAPINLRARASRADGAQRNAGNKKRSGFAAQSALEKRCTAGHAYASLGTVPRSARRQRHTRKAVGTV